MQWHRADLDVDLDDGLPYEGGSKEGPERYKKMAARYPSQIKEWVGNLQ